MDLPEPTAEASIESPENALKDSFVTLFVQAANVRCLADLGRAEWAVKVYALACRYPAVANSRWWQDVAGKQIDAAAATLPPDVVALAQERGRARDLWDMAEVLPVELNGR
jgi:hypothetical protein